MPDLPDWLSGLLGGQDPEVSPALADATDATGAAVGQFITNQRQQSRELGLLGQDGLPTPVGMHDIAQKVLGGFGPADLPGSSAGGFLGMFMGPKAKFADLDALAKAKTLSRWGADPNVIRVKTGWDQNAGGQWRWELPDDKMGLDLGNFMTDRNGNIAPYTGGGATTGDIINHSPLFDNYPELGKVGLTENQGNVLGAYYPAGPMSKVHQPPKLSLGLMPSEQARIVALHELQHGVQDLEGTPQGSSPSMFLGVTGGDSGLAKQYYQRTAGEVEANLTADRADLTGAQRKEQSPLVGEPIDRKDQQVIRQNATGGGFTLSPGRTPPGVGSSTIAVPREDLLNPANRPLLRELVLEGWTPGEKGGSHVTYTVAPYLRKHVGDGSGASAESDLAEQIIAASGGTP